MEKTLLTIIESLIESHNEDDLLNTKLENLIPLITEGHIEDIPSLMDIIYGTLINYGFNEAMGGK